MQKTILSISLVASLWGTPLGAQQIAGEPSLNPLVQQTTMGSATMPAPERFRLVVDAPRRSSLALSSISQWLNIPAGKASKGSLPLTLGIRGDKATSKVAHLVPSRSEGYYLSVSPQGITIAGADERGLFYGLQTLRQMLADGELALGTITDYPDVPYRGVVEGFYGTPWSYQDRLSQLEFYGRNKLNVYIYGPKDDPYHSVPNWRLPYPEQEAGQIKALVDYAHANGVIFYWAIHPGQDIKWTTEDRDALLSKFEAMYQLGVRGFAVFFDDISGEGTRADKQAELLNYIDDNFIKPKGDIAPLVMCPTEYNKAWSRIERGYLPTLGQSLNQGIEVMWTGNTVVATIDKPDMEWINGYIKRKGYVWFNFPVSDFVRNHLLLGETYGNSLDIAEDVSGFLSNPMEHAESSKIALYSIADYTWNMKAYDSEASWHRAIKAVFPEAPEALLTFASHSSALGDNGHRFDRKESVALQPTLSRIIDGRATDSDLERIAIECQSIRFAVNRLLASESNPSMLEEMRPWLKMAKLVAEYGSSIMAMDPTRRETFLSHYKQAQTLQRLMYLLDISENQNPYQPGVRYGSQLLLPALNAHLARQVERYNTATGEGLVVETSYTPFVLSSTIAQLMHQPIQTRGKQISISPSNEVISWAPGSSITLQARHGERIKTLSLDLGSKDLATSLRLEILVAGEWRPITLQQKEGETSLRPASSLEAIALQGIRLSYVGDSPRELRLRQFRFTIQ